MIPKDKQLLLKDLCARLPYGVIIAEFDKYDNQIKKFIPNIIGDDGYLEYDACRDGQQSVSLYSKVTRNYCKPYLRPMSSMTEEEKKVYNDLMLNTQVSEIYFPDCEDMIPVLDWLNAHHFDYRGLIEKGLALEALEGMYKTE